MTPLIGFRTGRKVDSSFVEVSPQTAGISVVSETPSRAADYAYRIAALAAGLVLLATSM
jgi:hypothetical protein